MAEMLLIIQKSMRDSCEAFIDIQLLSKQYVVCYFRLNPNASSKELRKPVYVALAR